MCLCLAVWLLVVWIAGRHCYCHFWVVSQHGCLCLVSVVLERFMLYKYFISIINCLTEVWQVMSSGGFLLADVLMTRVTVIPAFSPAQRSFDNRHSRRSQRWDDGGDGGRQHLHLWHDCWRCGCTSQERVGTVCLFYWDVLGLVLFSCFTGMFWVGTVCLFYWDVLGLVLFACFTGMFWGWYCLPVCHINSSVCLDTILNWTKQVNLLLTCAFALHVKWTCQYSPNMIIFVLC